MLSSYSEWATKFMESWKALDGEKTAELLFSLSEIIVFDLLW